MSTPLRKKFCFTYFDIKLTRDIDNTTQNINQTSVNIEPNKDHTSLTLESNNESLSEYTSFSKKSVYTKLPNDDIIIQINPTNGKIEDSSPINQKPKNPSNGQYVKQNKIKHPIFSLIYELCQLYNDGRAYFCSIKNFLEIVNILTSDIILFTLFYLKYLTTSSSLFEKIKQVIPVCLLLKHLAFILCLEKMDYIGIYVVAFRCAFKKSLLISPIIILLFSGFILAFKMQSNPLNEKFNNTSVHESVAEFGKMLLSNIDENTTLGMASDSFTNYFVFFVFVILVPILLINLLIGVSTGELREILDVSDLMQYQMRLEFILGLQDYLVNKFDFKFCEKMFVFKIYTGKESKKKNIHSIEKSDSNLQTFMEKLEQQQNKHFESLAEKLVQHNKEMDLKLSHQTNKIQTLQDGMLVRMNQHEKLIEAQFSDFEQNTMKQMNSMASDLIKKS